MEESGELNAWLGKPPDKFDSVSSGNDHDVQAEVRSEDRSPSPSVSSEAGDVIEVSQQPTFVHVTAPQDQTTAEPDTIVIDGEGDNEEESRQQDSDSEAGSQFVVNKQEDLTIDVPELPEDEKEDYDYLPNHFTVKRILYALGNGSADRKYVVKLLTGELDLVDRVQLTTEFRNGKLALNAYRSAVMQRKAHPTHVPPRLPTGLVDWNKIETSDSEVEPPARKRRKRYTKEVLSDVEPTRSSSDEFADEEDDLRPAGRRSIRLAPKHRTNYFANELSGIKDSLDSDEDISQPGRSRRPKRQATRHHSSSKPTRSVRARKAAESEERDLKFDNARRSERTRTQPRRSMRERQEDELSSQSEKDLAPKVVGTKEVFVKMPVNDPFRKRHQQECATCYHTGDHESKGPLVFCQGCSNSYHKTCLGHRGSREHLVTKVGDHLFVLQCRRCIGVARVKDPAAPHYGKCSECDRLAPLSKPLRRRITTRQEQIQREENGGIDPITITQPGTINNVENVMFRCATCSRGWHLHHMPNRKTANSADTDEEDLDERELAQKRFDMYHRSWTCKDCVENQASVDTLVAWRPTNQDSYIPGTTIDNIQEAHKEYLVKWKNQSYHRCTWMPGTWVWGVVGGGTRAAFYKRSENQLPRMTTKDAIPEEYHRIDIVFDVRYTSVVRNSSEQIDLARVKEVDTAFVKFKGLGYEDAIWEKPPTYSDKERFKDFKEAYEDLVKKRYMSIPVQSTLRRTLANVRQQDFGTKLIRKQQPSILTGGQVMQYQLEGLNWLYYQWYRQHNAILADEMGLGKTIQLIALMATLVQEHKCWPFLIVVPNSTCPNWRREFKKWAPSLRAVCYYGSSAARKLVQDFELFPKDPDADPDKKKSRSEVKDIKAHVVIASYESIIDKTVLLNLQRVPWQGLIVDEGQRLKCDQNLIYEALSKLRVPFKVLMTGTPLQNNARELFNLLQFLDREKHNAAELDKRYAELTQENVPELHDMLKPYFLRRTKVQVLTFLPPMAQIILPVTMSALQKQVAKSIMSQNPALMKSIFSRDGNAPIKERANLNNILMQLRKTLCHPFVYSREIEDRSLDSDATFKRLVEASSKLQLLSIMLPELRERGHRVLMFSQFLDNLDIVEDFLDGLGMLHRRLDGTISTLEKQKRIDEFNTPESPYFAFLLSTRAGGVGINLATADTVIILDPDFNPHQDIQALSRAHRIGQQNKVLVFQLMTRSSAEEKIMQIGKKKMALDHVLIEAMDQPDDAGMDLESILRHGAAALFDDDAEADIVYTEASVDKLLDRSQAESTKTSESQSAESQFSFARIWANDKAALEEGLRENSSTSTPNPDIWDKILKERQKAFEAAQARKAEELGRGKRRRVNVDYGGKPTVDGDVDGSPTKGRADGDDHTDDEFEEQDNGPETDVDVTTAAEDTEPEIQMVQARPFKRVKVPQGQAPMFNGDMPPGYIHIPVPAPHKCQACKEEHPMGWCRLKIAGVEHCGLCGLAHMGHGRTCPHLNDEKQVETLLMTLKESTESRDLIDEAVRYLRVIRGDLVSHRRQRERRAQQEKEAQLAARRNQFPPPGRPPAAGRFVQPPIMDVDGNHRNAGLSIGANSEDYAPSPQRQAPVGNEA
ncbi:hypothetical protein LTR64_001451 [Lithohypha guttulata]|uniref:uncharacterized protein n=1 Tax=Lithohypha guttulata TaxID=1690604 RepID=UPI002DDF1CA8|nr:hypothetical protein LTR51_003645 [Lithohypha guttulata]